jgi:superfamily II DNA or RNA helicase
MLLIEGFQMAIRLEDLCPDVTVSGILPHRAVTVVSAQWSSSDAVVLVYKDASGELGQDLLFRDREPLLEIVTNGKPWSFDGDGALLRLVSEAHRIQLAHLFDPHLAVHTSLVEPLPHQIAAVYGEMIPRQPLRFLLADDPGAGKTIMAGLLMRELLVRGDLHRCLVVCPGSLAAQWQDELYQKFHLPFDILTSDRIESARSGNALAEMSLVIVRLDQLSRNEALQAKLEQTDWDLVVCDEAHKMSAAFFGNEIQTTKRYRLGQLLSKVTRHFLLMSATPHNGKEEDFQLFMALLDGDRFERRHRNGVDVVDASDLMRRLVKEDLLKFDGKPLFPERRAITVTYQLSELESQLYQSVTDYVRQEFNRADALENDGRKGTVGFALTVLQRRLASSPEAIYQSLQRRRERLQKRLQEEGQVRSELADSFAFGRQFDLDDLEDDLDEFSGEEREMAEEELVDRASAARTVAELEVEIAALEKLEHLALQVRRSGKDKKWEQLSQLLQEQTEMFDADGRRRKLVIFTEHRDTLNYLTDRIGTLLGRPEAVVAIHGSLKRDDRKRAEVAFKQDIEVQVLLATDAAGEGINLQRAHLMVNYDLPWNPNRLEQRFGRIHRIGQTEVCHLWNLVAADTREGDVYWALLRKLEAEQKSLGGKVFDVLGTAIASRELRKLLVEAIRYGDRPDVRNKLNQVVGDRLDRQRLQELIEEQALARDSMDVSKVQAIREEMERAEARRLQPHFIGSFFLEAFQHLGGSVRQREDRRYEIKHVPAAIRNSHRVGLHEPIGQRYERICFDKERISISGKPVATFVCPGHPLLDTTLDLTLERHRDLLKRGAVLVNENDQGEQVRALVYLEHSIQDAKVEASGRRRVVSKRMQYVEIATDGEARDAGYAPYLDYRPLDEAERVVVAPVLETLELREQIETRATTYAIVHLVPQHLQEVRQQREALNLKTAAAVKDRLTKEINYWDRQAEKLRQQEAAGRPNARLNSAKARQRADELESRLQRRLTELELERQLSPLPPLIVGGALVVPLGLLQRLQGKRQAAPATFARETERVEQLAMDAVMEAERSLGYEPQDVSRQNYGYDIESRVLNSGQLRFIEVKGRIEGAETVTVTKNEILTALNKPEHFILALVQVPQSVEFAEGDAWRVRERSGDYRVEATGCAIRYVRDPFQTEPDFGVTSVNYGWKDLWQRGTPPS